MGETLLFQKLALLDLINSDPSAFESIERIIQAQKIIASAKAILTKNDIRVLTELGEKHGSEKLLQAAGLFYKELEEGTHHDPQVLEYVDEFLESLVKAGDADKDMRRLYCKLPFAAYFGSAYVVLLNEQLECLRRMRQILGSGQQPAVEELRGKFALERKIYNRSQEYKTQVKKNTNVFARSIEAAEKNALAQRKRNIDGIRQQRFSVLASELHALRSLRKLLERNHQKRSISDLIREVKKGEEPLRRNQKLFEALAMNDVLEEYERIQRDLGVTGWISDRLEKAAQ